MKKVAVLALGVLVAACSETPTQTSTMDVPVAQSQVNSPITHLVRGGGTVDLGDPNGGAFFRDGVELAFGFQAQMLANGSVRGSIQESRVGEDEVWLKVDVTCLAVVGNRAFMGGTIVASESNPILVGRGFTNFVEDNGLGANGNPDRISQFFVVTSQCDNPAVQNALINGGSTEWNNGEVVID